MADCSHKLCATAVPAHLASGHSCRLNVDLQHCSVHLSHLVDYKVPSRTMDARPRGEGSGRVQLDFSILNELCVSFLHLGLTLGVENNQ